MGCLKNLVITSVGDHGDGKGNEQLKKWVEANGGRWQPRVSKDITHVICSKGAWKKNVEAVQQAKNLDVFIISYDWLEDSLMKKRRLKETKYTWEVLRKQRRTKKELKRLAPRSDALKFKKGCDLALEDLGSGTSTSRKSSFFRSSLEDIQRRREERAAAKSAVGTEDTPEDAQKDLLSPSLESASTPTTPAQHEFSTQSTPVPPSVLHHQSGASSSPISRTQTSTPAPSLFPPGLKYSAPTGSHPSAGATSAKSGTPQSSKSPGPAPAPAANPQVTKLTDLYHVYCDSTGFHYDIILLRQNPYLNNFAKYTLRLYESHTKPHVYATAVRYTPPAGSHNTSTKPKPGENEFAAILGKAIRNAKSKKEENPTSTPAETTRLTALITTPTPSSTRPFNKIITPPNSPFLPAMHAFRHVFRDLTLLTWEERLSPTTTPLTDPNSLQRLRAQAFQIEPFIWRPPAPGMPVGRLPVGCEGVDFCASDMGYVRNRYELPALDEPLGEEGMLGSALVREAVSARRKEEEEEERKRVEAKKKRSLALGRKGNAGKLRGNGVSGNSRGSGVGHGGVKEVEDRGAKKDGRAVFTHFAPRSDWHRSRFLAGDD